MRPFANLLCTLVNCYYFTAGRVRSITISVSVCLCDRISQKRRVETYPDLPVAVHGSALFRGVLIQYVLPVLWMTSVLRMIRNRQWGIYSK